MYLTDGELQDVLRDLGEVLGPRLANQPAPGRVRRLLTTVLMPAEPATTPFREEIS
jgi:hypothetical protein